jgi:hypothetical protein
MRPIPANTGEPSRSKCGRPDGTASQIGQVRFSAQRLLSFISLAADLLLPLPF